MVHEHLIYSALSLKSDYFDFSTAEKESEENRYNSTKFLEEFTCKVENLADEIEFRTNFIKSLKSIASKIKIKEYREIISIIDSSCFAFRRIGREDNVLLQEAYMILNNGIALNLQYSKKDNIPTFKLWITLKKKS